jgi:hypothetical protein
VAATPNAATPPSVADPRGSSRFRAAIDLLTALDVIAQAHPDLPELHPACLHADGVDLTPWLLCRPVTALQRWMKVLPSPGEVTALDLGDVGTRLSVTSTLGSATVTLQVVTHVVDLATAVPGVVNATELAVLAASEPGMPDLQTPLKAEAEAVAAPHAPMPALRAPVPAS